jgi:ribose-phosphate pyrophosphokinase
MTKKRSIMDISTIDSNGKTNSVAYDSFTFSGGEEHVRFTPADFQNIKTVKVHARLNHSSSLIQLMIAMDALKRIIHKDVAIELTIPYFPYARQDRVCVEGEALGAAVIANFINNLRFDKVTIWDAHSDVSPALLDNVTNVAQVDILKEHAALSQEIENGELMLVSPDAGAAKKTLKIAEAFEGKAALINAQKIRDVKTGKILNTEVSGDVYRKKLLIVDDICDGGRTFIELAKVLKSKGASEVSLFVTHGIFSKGFEVFEGLIDKIYTTDSFQAASDINNTSKTQLSIIEIKG